MLWSQTYRGTGDRKGCALKPHLPSPPAAWGRWYPPVAGTHQFRGDAPLGHGAHLRNARLHLCFDVALLSSRKTDACDTLGKEMKVGASIYPAVHFFSVFRVYSEPGTVPGTGYRDEQNRWKLCPHAAELLVFLTKYRKQPASW